MAAPSTSQFDQDGFGISAFVEVLKNVFEIAAIGSGAIWAYSNFFRSHWNRMTL